MLQFGLRLGERPRQVVTTTPRPIGLFKIFHARDDYEGGSTGGGSSSPNPGTEPTAGSGQSDPRVLSDATPYNYYKPGAQIAANDGQRPEPIRLELELEDEELRGGHAIEFHVNRSEAALKAQALEVFDSNPNADNARSGSFSSLAAANKLVNSTLRKIEILLTKSPLVCLNVRPL